jgi:hypothetical protein
MEQSLDNLTVAQLIKKCPEISLPRSLITVIASARNYVTKNNLSYSEALCDNL